MRERLIELRKHLNVSQREFCEKLSLTQSTYAPFETGKRELRDSYVRLICQIYHVSEDWLREGTLPMFVEDRDRDLDELLYLFDKLTPELQQYLLKQAK